MYTALIPIVLIMVAGYVWQRIEPGGMDAQTVANVLNQLLLRLFAPVLIFAVLVRADLGVEVIAIPVAGVASILAAVGISMLFYGFLGRIIKLSRSRQGSLVLASSFANGSLALPVCMALFGEPGMKGAMLFDLLATIPMIWTLGVVIAIGYSGGSLAPGGLGREMLGLPPLWGVAAALLVNFLGIEVPESALSAGWDFGQAAIPLMVFIIGLSLRVDQLRHLGLLIPALVIRLLLAPLVGLAVGKLLSVDSQTMAITMLAMASASPAVGILLTYRYDLDAPLYGAALSLSMLGYILAAPLYTLLI
ncbi:MAG: AEC family transporter [Gammaproteobacteria bacterium]